MLNINCYQQTNNTKLTLLRPSNEFLTVQAVEVELVQLGEQVVECRLTIQVSPDVYQQIERLALFHLKPEVRGPIFGGRFQAEVDIEIEARLSSRLLPRLTSHIKTVEEAGDYLLGLSQRQPLDPLLATESWFALSVKQPMPLPPSLAGGSLKTGYRTAWYDLEVMEQYIFAIEAQAHL